LRRKSDRPTIVFSEDVDSFALPKQKSKPAGKRGGSAFLSKDKISKLKERLSRKRRRVQAKVAEVVKKTPTPESGEGAAKRGKSLNGNCYPGLNSGKNVDNESVLSKAEKRQKAPEIRSELNESFDNGGISLAGEIARNKQANALAASVNEDPGQNKAVKEASESANGLVKGGSSNGKDYSTDDELREEVAFFERANLTFPMVVD